MPARTRARRITKQKQKQAPQKYSSKNVTPNGPTTAQNQKLLRRAVSPSTGNMDMAPYAMCRLNPFCGLGSMYPDGSTERRIVIDFRSFCDITITSSVSKYLYLRAMPMLPCPVLVKGGSATDSFSIVNSGGTSSFSAQTVTGGDLTVGWLAGVLMPEYTNGYPGTVGAVPSLYSASKGRIISIGHRLIYTGSANNVQGLVTVCPGSASVVSRGVQVPDYKVLSTPDTGAATSIGTDLSDTIRINTSFISNPTITGAKSVYVAAGMSGTNPQVSDVLEFRPISKLFAGLIGDDQMLTTANVSYVNSSTGYRGGVHLYDESWAPLDITISNVAGTTSYRVETVVCVEFIVDPTSSVQRFSRAPPPANPTLLRKLGNYLKSGDIAGDLQAIERNVAGFTMKGASLAATAAKLAAMAM